MTGLMPAVTEGGRLRAYWPAVEEALSRLPETVSDGLRDPFEEGDRIPHRLPGWKLSDGGVRRALRLATAFDVTIRCLKALAEMEAVDEVRVRGDGAVVAKRSLSANAVAEWLARGADVPKVSAPAVWKALRATMRARRILVPGLICQAGEGRSLSVRFHPN